MSERGGELLQMYEEHSEKIELKMLIPRELTNSPLLSFRSASHVAIVDLILVQPQWNRLLNLPRRSRSIIIRSCVTIRRYKSQGDGL